MNVGISPGQEPQDTKGRILVPDKKEHGLEPRRTKTELVTRQNKKRQNCLRGVASITCAAKTAKGRGVRGMFGGGKNEKSHRGKSILSLMGEEAGVVTGRKVRGSRQRRKKTIRIL